MSTIQLKVMNEREVIAALKAAGIKPRTVLKAAMLAAADVIEAAAEKDAPGPNLDREVVEDRGSKVSVHVGPEKAKWYYRFFETGTGAKVVRPKNQKSLMITPGVMRAGAVAGPMAAKPFLRPAVDNHSDKAADAAGVVIQRVLG